MSETTYLELVEGVGVEPTHLHELDNDGQHKQNPRAGEPAELKSIGIQIPMPTKVEQNGEIVITTSSAVIEPLPAVGDEKDNPVQSRIIPGTRIVETRSPAVASLLIETGHYQTIDPPASEQPRKPRKGEEAES